MSGDGTATRGDLPAELRCGSPSERIVPEPGLGEHVLLAIDTALGTSVALGRGGRIVEAVSDEPMRHAEAVGPLIARVLERGGVPAGAVTGVVVGVGPGPFTGLRVGIAAARAFAIGAGAPLLPLQGHDAVAFSVLESGRPVRVVQDARRSELFVTEYPGLDPDGIPARSSGPAVVARAELSPSAADLWPERIPAAALVQLGVKRLDLGRSFEPPQAVYLRAPDVRRAAGGPPLRVRPARPADLEPAWAIETTVFGADAWSRESLKQEFEGDHRQAVVLVDHRDAVRGYGVLLTLGGEADVQTLAVAPEARGRGGARALLTELLLGARASGAREVFLEVRADNAPAHALYRSFGFEEIGTRPAYYQPDGVDARVMRLGLGSSA